MPADYHTLIENLRFGHVNIKFVSDKTLMELEDYYLPVDVMGMLHQEINRRRNNNLETKETKETHK